MNDEMENVNGGEFDAPVVQEEGDLSKGRKWYQQPKFWIGFFGWFIVNGALWFLRILSVINDWWFGFDPFLINIGGLILLALIPTTRRIAFGALMAFAVSFIIVLLLGILFLAYCFLTYS